jgi:3',5'-cyclic AMP phosphodiesterase CpdA
MSVLLQISEPHFGTEQPQVVEPLAALAARQRPDVIGLSGDITQRARRAPFAAARHFMNRLSAPVLALPGNQDIALFDLWARLFRPYAHHLEAFGAALEPVHATPELLLMGVNPTRAWRHKHGEVSVQQIERVARLLSNAGHAQLRVVVVHQPAAVVRGEDAVNLLRGHAVALNRWAAAGADLVMGGHTHLPYTTLVAGLEQPVWAVQAGTSVSRRVRPGVPNSVNLLRWSATPTPRNCAIEQRGFSAADQALVCAKVTHVLNRPGF